MKLCQTLLCLTLTLLLPVTALAAETTANGTVEAVHHVDITAPFSGTLLPFDHDAGDRVSAGDVLFTLDTLKVYAPDAGTLTALFAGVGDVAADVTAQYGMLAAVEKTNALRIEASTTGGYDSQANKVIHTGETLYYECVEEEKDEGSARVVAVSGGKYELEVLTGDYELGTDVKLYRDEDLSSKQRVGRGRITRAADLPVFGSGRVLRLYAAQGDLVAKGQLLMELAADAEPGMTSAEITAPGEGVLSAARVVSGQQVYRGQALATLYDMTELQVRAEVDETDLGALNEGDKVELSFDRYPGKRTQGRVASIAALGKTKQNASYYDVCVAFQPEEDTLLGMSATLFIPGEE